MKRCLAIRFQAEASDVPGSSGEELFEVFVDPRTDEVIYRIRATSRPRALLARVGQPIVRVLQARFRSDSVNAMKRATSGNGFDDEHLP
jgi:hypothetical protein